MNTYGEGLAAQSVKHYYAGAEPTPKKQSTTKGSMMACKKNPVKPKK